MPTSSAMSRTVAFEIPLRANTDAAAWSISSRRLESFVRDPLATLVAGAGVIAALLLARGGELGGLGVALSPPVATERDAPDGIGIHRQMANPVARCGRLGHRVGQPPYARHLDFDDIADVHWS